MAANWEGRVEAAITTEEWEMLQRISQQRDEARGYPLACVLNPARRNRSIKRTPVWIWLLGLASLILIVYATCAALADWLGQ